MPRILPTDVFVPCGSCVPDQIVALSPCTSAIAQDGPIDPCISNGLIYVTFSVVAAPAMALEKSPASFTERVSAGGVERIADSTSSMLGKPFQSDQAT